MTALLFTILGVGLGAYLSTFPAEIVRASGLLLIGGSTAGLIIWSFYEYGMPKMGPAILALVGVGFIIGASAWHIQLSNAQAQPQQTQPGVNIIGNGNIFAPNQSGGTNTINNNYAPKPRILSDEQKKQFLEKIPKTKTVTVGCNFGDVEAYNYASLIWGFLKSQGFKVGDGFIQYTVPASGPLVINWNEGSADGPVQITVGKNE